MSYTKGPWVKDGLHVVGSSGKMVVISDGPAFGSKSSFPQAEDNARLVMASPLLLEALQNMLGAFDNPIVRRKYRDEFTDAAIASARDAIEAATQTKSEEVDNEK